MIIFKIYIFYARMLIANDLYTRYFRNLYIYDKRYISISYNLDPLGQTGIGYFLWGTGRQENILFASTETNDYSIRCHHSAFDTAVMREVFKFNTRESGDSMAINPTGKRS